MSSDFKMFRFIWIHFQFQIYFEFLRDIPFLIDSKKREKIVNTERNINAAFQTYLLKFEKFKVFSLNNNLNSN